MSLDCFGKHASVPPPPSTQAGSWCHHLPAWIFNWLCIHLLSLRPLPYRLGKLHVSWIKGSKRVKVMEEGSRLELPPLPVREQVRQSLLAQKQKHESRLPTYLSIQRC